TNEYALQFRATVEFALAFYLVPIIFSNINKSSRGGASIGYWHGGGLGEDKGNVYKNARLGMLVRQLGNICEPVYLVAGGHVLNLSILGIPLPPLK
ncbi:MAG: hypothetical protein ACKPGB_14495, partial [Dolichospermum sp.]